MDIKNVNSVVNLDKTAFASKPKEAEKKDNASVAKDTAVETKITTRKNAVSDIEMQAILENLTSAESKITDVEKAEEMIRKANSNILEKKDEAVLSQANQSKDVVEKLTR